METHEVQKLIEELKKTHQEQVELLQQQVQALEKRFNSDSKTHTSSDDDDEDKKVEIHNRHKKKNELVVEGSDSTLNSTRDFAKWKFDIKHFSGASREVLVDWLFLLKQAFATQKLSETDKVHVAVSYLRKHALVWYQSIYQDFGSDLKSFESFKIEIEKCFGDPYLQQNARTKMLQLQQFSSLVDYNHQWRALKYQIRDMSVDNQLANYLNGLKLKISIEVKLKEPKSIEAAMRMAEFYC